MEDADFDKQKKTNKFRFIEEDDEQELGNPSKFNPSSIAESADEVVLDSFTNPSYDPAKKNTIKLFNEDGSDDELD